MEKCCFRCAKIIDELNQSLCFYQKHHYHEECCKICTPLTKLIVKSTLPQAPIKPKIEKSKGGPGKLNFNKLGTFEKNDVVNCKDCKKKIIGQRFLTNKIGEFRCKDCNSLLEEKCFVCKVSFDKNGDIAEKKEFFKDDEQNTLCNQCIKIYREEKISKEEKKQQDENNKAIDCPKPMNLKKTLHCDRCTKEVTLEVVYFEGENLCLKCFSCYSCKNSLKYQAVFQEDKRLACVQCKSSVNCKYNCFIFFSNNQKQIIILNIFKVKIALIV